MKYLIPLFILLLLPNIANAKRWYNVEVIIFAYTSDAGLQEEHWPLEPGEPDTSNSVSLVRNAGQLPGQITEFEVLRFNMLSSALNRLRRSSRYDVLYSRAWRLPDLPSRSAPPVRIRAGKRFTSSGNYAPAVIANNTDGSLDGVVDDALYEIDGRIKISLSKFLDVDADLLYRRHVTLPDADGLPVNEFRQFRLTEFRRMKSKTIHYLDHPLFGVVIAIDRHHTNETFEQIQPKSAGDINR